MLDVNKGLTDKLGVDWTNAGSIGFNIATATKGSLFPFGFDAERKPDYHALDSAGKLSFIGPNTDKSLTIVLNYLKTKTDAKSLARPKILTMNNETAEIRIATSEVVGTNTQVIATSGGGATGLESANADRQDTGIVLRVTPMINKVTGEITMRIFPSQKVSSASTFVDSFGNTFRNVEERSTRSLVKVRDGETIILGGLISTDYTEGKTSVPILGDIPVLGALFRNKSKTRDSERELLVFITPRIVQEAPVEFAQARTVGSMGREQEIVSGTERKTKVDERLDAVERKKLNRVQD
jgi:type II secretory pathway component GspD/PulD (secretin)